MAAAEEELHEYFQANYPEVVVRVGEITFGEQRMLKDTIKEIEKKLREQSNKDKSKKANKDTEKKIGQLKSEQEKKLKSQATALTQAACALLNSGGGVIRAEIENKDYSYQKHGIGRDIENAFRECIQQKNLSEYFDFKQQESSMLIFVKSWSSENSTYQRVCSLNTGLYERSSSSAVKMKPTNAVCFLKRKKDHAKVASGSQAGPTPAKVQKLSLQPGVQTEKDISDAAAQFFEREQLDLGEILDFTESTTVEFKDFSRDKDNYEFARSILPRYASAFANTKGGYLIFGVDNHRKVVGCKSNICPSRFIEVVGDTINTLSVFHFCASKKKIGFSCKSLPVYGRSENGEKEEHGYVFVVRIEPSCCVVFETTPDSWIMEDGEVKRLTCTEWTLLMTEEDPDVSHFAEGFQIELCRAHKPPLSRSVYSNKGLTGMKTLQTNLFPAHPRRASGVLAEHDLNAGRTREAVNMSEPLQSQSAPLDPWMHREAVQAAPETEVAEQQEEERNPGEDQRPEVEHEEEAEERPPLRLAEVPAEQRLQMMQRRTRVAVLSGLSEKLVQQSCREHEQTMAKMDQAIASGEREGERDRALFKETCNKFFGIMRNSVSIMADMRDILRNLVPTGRGGNVVSSCECQGPNTATITTDD